MRVSSDMPNDVLVLHDALEKLREYKQSPITNYQSPIILNLKNCGTALRFLQVHLEKCYPGAPITLTGDPRLMERDGKPTSQTTSAKILHGGEVPVEENESPYITMSRKIAEAYPNVELEADWSSAAFWYEYIAIHGGELFLEGLKSDSLQGDKIVVDIYAKYFGVETEFVDGGALIKKSSISNLHSPISLDFERIPDLYPAVAIACKQLGTKLFARGTEVLRIKESDRLQAVKENKSYGDHRIAMALLSADFACDDIPCINKSYPTFYQQLCALRG